MTDFNVKTALRAIKARRTEAQADEQDELNAAGRGRLDPNSPSERIARARQQEKDLQEQLEWLQIRPRSDVKTMRIDAMMDRLGELAAEQGDYERAATISKTPERREHYKMIVDAIKKPDDLNCECEPDLIVDRKSMQEFRSNAIMTVDTIVSPDGGSLNLDRCRKCGHANAR